MVSLMCYHYLMFFPYSPEEREPSATSGPGWFKSWEDYDEAFGRDQSLDWSGEPVCTVDPVTGDTSWKLNDELHNPNGPAFIHNPRKPQRTGNLEGVYYYQRGVLHRVGAPAVELYDGTLKWRQYGLPHNLDGPSTIESDGTELWDQYGERHRVGNPAIIIAKTGQREWYQRDLLHNTEGPAMEWIGEDGICEEAWYVNGRELDALEIAVLKQALAEEKGY